MRGRNGSELAILDVAFLERQTFGDTDLEHEVLNLFLDQAGRLLPTLPALSPARQSEAAHLIKGSCQGIGADRLADLLQRYGEADGAGRARAHPVLTAALADTRAAILARLPPG